MKYYILALRKKEPDKKVILGEYDDLETALSFGEQFNETAERGDIISCISDYTKEPGRERFVIHESWFC